MSFIVYFNPSISSTTTGVVECCNKSCVIAEPDSACAMSPLTNDRHSLIGGHVSARIHIKRHTSFYAGVTRFATVIWHSCYDNGNALSSEIKAVSDLDVLENLVMENVLLLIFWMLTSIPMCIRFIAKLQICCNLLANFPPEKIIIVIWHRYRGVTRQWWSHYAIKYWTLAIYQFVITRSILRLAEYAKPPLVLRCGRVNTPHRSRRHNSLFMTFDQSCN